MSAMADPISPGAGSVLDFVAVVPLGVVAAFLILVGVAIHGLGWFWVFVGAADIPRK